jgi:hypothetical protein
MTAVEGSVLLSARWRFHHCLPHELADHMAPMHASYYRDMRKWWRCFTAHLDNVARSGHPCFLVPAACMVKRQSVCREAAELRSSSLLKYPRLLQDSTLSLICQSQMQVDSQDVEHESEAGAVLRTRSHHEACNLLIDVQQVVIENMPAPLRVHREATALTELAMLGLLTGQPSQAGVNRC